MKENYIKAVLLECQAGIEPEVVLSGLKTTLNRRGHTQLYPAILRGVLRVLVSKNANDTAITIKDETDLKKHQEAITAALQKLNASTEPTVIFDETIVGGFIAEANKQRIDNSYKTKLVKLYRTLTR